VKLRRYLGGSLAHYWKLNVAVVVGVAMAVSTLAGALLVGSSVRASLRAIVLARIGATDFALTAPHYFRASLAEELGVAGEGAVRAAYGFVSLEGSISHEPSGRRASRVVVYGIDAGFFGFHGVPAPELGAREALLSPSLQAELAGEVGDVAVRTARRAGPDAPLAIGRGLAAPDARRVLSASQPTGGSCGLPPTRAAAARHGPA